MEDTEYIMSVKLLWMHVKARTLAGAICVLIFAAMLFVFLYLMALQGLSVI